MHSYIAHDPLDAANIDTWLSKQQQKTPTPKQAKTTTKTKTPTPTPKQTKTTTVHRRTYRVWTFWETRELLHILDQFRDEKRMPWTRISALMALKNYNRSPGSCRKHTFVLRHFTLL
jgi:glucan-binding YG repeat protein